MKNGRLSRLRILYLSLCNMSTVTIKNEIYLSRWTDAIRTHIHNHRQTRTYKKSQRKDLKRRWKNTQLSIFFSCATAVHFLCSSSFAASQTEKDADCFFFWFLPFSVYLIIKDHKKVNASCDLSSSNIFQVIHLTMRKKHLHVVVISSIVFIFVISKSWSKFSCVHFVVFVVCVRARAGAFY